METSKVYLRGIGQVLLQNNAATGLLFLIGIAANSIIMAAAALLGSIIGSEFARLMRFSKSDIQQGLYGFNSCLVAIAAVLFFDLSVAGIALAILGSILACQLMQFMQQRNLYPFTFPFIIITWLALYLLPQQALSTDWQLLPDTFFSAKNYLHSIDAALYGFGQIMFQASSVTGLCFLVGIMLNQINISPWLILASALSILLAQLLHWPNENMQLGIYSYNSILTVIAIFHLGRAYFLPAVLLAAAVTFAMLKLQLSALTFPFVLSTWLLISLHALLGNRPTGTTA